VYAHALLEFCLNGEVDGFFHPERGLRQGCLLSPYLFILYTKVLSSLFSASERRGEFRGMKINHVAPSISHLIIFGEASPHNLESVKAILDTYSRWSGQVINVSKSSIHFIIMLLMLKKH